MKISSVEEMRLMDETAMLEYGIPSELLMENAGHAVASVIQENYGIRGSSFLVFCGAGNNGGDGWVIARKLYSMGGEVKVFLFDSPEKYTGAAQLNYNIVSHLPIPVSRIGSIKEVQTDFLNCDVVIDAIFGTGLSREVSGIYQEVIETINSCGKPVFSVDIPSGVNGNNGQILGVAVRAAHTITFGLPKVGNLLYPGYELGGKLHCAHISFPPSLYDADSLKIELNTSLPLPSRDPAGHKGDFGEVLFIAGSANYYGAPYFAALSFLNAGGGYSRLAAPRSIVPFIASKGSEIVFHPQEETLSGCIGLSNLQALQKLSDQMDMVVLGSGFSLDEEAQDVVSKLTTRINKPLLIDGDGITAIAQKHHLIRSRTAPTILTPHLGEMSRLTGLDINTIKTNPIAVLQETSRELDVIVVLKGAHTMIGLPTGQVYLNLSGNSGMATAGSGDVLTGTIAAMFGLGLSVEDASRKGVFIHGLAGDLAATAKGVDGITAQDILEYLPFALKQDRAGLSEKLSKRYIIPEII